MNVKIDWNGYRLFDFLVGDYAIAIGLIIFIAGIFRIFRTTCRDIWREPVQLQRIISRSIVVLGLVTIVWISAFDNWRKFIGVFTSWVQDERSAYVSDPFLSAGTSDLVRAISWTLFLGVVVGGAYLYARYSRGIVEPIILGPLSLVLFFVLNTFRLRIDTESVRIAYGTIEGPAEITSTLVWIAMLWVSMAILITAMYFMIWAPIALVSSIVYRTTFGKQALGDAPILRKIRERHSTY